MSFLRLEVSCRDNMLGKDHGGKTTIKKARIAACQNLTLKVCRSKGRLFRQFVPESELVVDTDLNAGHAVVLEALAAEELGNALVFKVGIGQLARTGSSVWRGCRSNRCCISSRRRSRPWSSMHWSNL